MGGRILQRRPSWLNVNWAIGMSMLVGCLGPVLVVVLDGRLPAPWGYVLGVGLVYSTASVPKGMWRNIAVEWIMEEKPELKATKDGGALFLSGLSFAQGLGTALATAGLMIGLEAAGLDLKDCTVLCEERGGSDQVSSCLEVCQTQNRAEQPEAVRQLMKYVWYVAVPVLQLIAAILIITFPIKGTRLK